MGADLQGRPEDIPLLVGKLRDDVDIGYTRKAQPVEELSVRISSAVYHYVFSRITRSPRFEEIGTFRAFSRKFLAALLEYRERNVLYGPLMGYMGFKSAIVAVAHEPPSTGARRSPFSNPHSLTTHPLSPPNQPP